MANIKARNLRPGDQVLLDGEDALTTIYGSEKQIELRTSEGYMMVNADETFQVIRRGTSAEG